MKRIKPKNQRNCEKGITLIALIITIVILLALTGITVKGLKGNSRSD